MSTFGDTNIESNQAGLTAGEIQVFKATLPVDGVCQSMTIRLGDVSGSAGNLKLVLYRVSAGAPGALVASTSALALDTGMTSTWQTMTFSSPPSLVAADYFLGYLTDTSAQSHFLYAASGGTRYYKAGATYPTAPDPYGTPDGNDALTASIYATYTTAVAPVADFTGTPTTITSGQTVTFTDASTNTPTSWHWEKNDGTGWVDFSGSPTTQNPTETFT